MAVPIFFAIGFAACIIGAYHKPHPNSIKLGVVGPAAETARSCAAVLQAAGSSFDDQPGRDGRDATHDVRHRILDAAFVPHATRSDPRR